MDTNRFTSRGKFLQYSVFEAPGGTLTAAIKPSDVRIERGEVTVIDPKRNTFSFGSPLNTVFLTFVRGKLFLGNTDGINLTVPHKAIIRESVAILAGGNRTAVNYVTGLTNGGVIPFYPPPLSLNELPAFNLACVDGSKIIFEWITADK